MMQTALIAVLVLVVLGGICAFLWQRERAEVRGQLDDPDGRAEWRDRIRLHRAGPEAATEMAYRALIRRALAAMYASLFFWRNWPMSG